MHVLTDWLLTSQRVAIHVPTATAVVADLHLGYDGARRRSGEAVPTFDLDRSLAPLKAVLAGHAIDRLVIAGDLFEDGRHTGELGPAFLAWVSAQGIDQITVVPGNHDRNMTGWPGDRATEVKLGPWRVVHGDGRLPRGPVVHGHLHPSFRWQGLAAPCYLVGPRRIILPAFSADAAGVNVRGVASWRSYRCYAIVGEEVLDFGELARLSARRRIGS